MFEFWRFKTLDSTIYTQVTADFNFYLVFLSVIISALASYSALVVLERIWQSNERKTKTLWLNFGSFVMGIGVWAMHFTGMLAYMIPIPMSFQPILTIISVFPAMIGAYLALKLLSGKNFTTRNIQLAALPLALGIGLMHFIGMEAMETTALMFYDFITFITSIITAYILASIALHLIAYIIRIERYHLLGKVICSIAMGATIASMHYVGMASVSFYILGNISELPHYMETDPLVISFAIAGITAVFVATTIICAIVDQRLQLAEQALRESLIRQDDILENLADGLLIIDSSGKIVSANSAALRMFSVDYNAITQCKIEQLIPSVTSEQLVDDIVLFNHHYLGEMIMIDGLRKNGESFPIEAHFSKMTLVIDGKVMFSCALRDITNRVQLEEQLRQAQKLESIGQLAAGIAHEINTPTQYVSDNTNFMNDGFKYYSKLIERCQLFFEKEKADIDDQEYMPLKLALEDPETEYLTNEIPLAINQSLDGLQRISTIVGAMKSFSHPSKGEMQLVDIIDAIETTVTVTRNEWRYIAEVTTTTDGIIPKILCSRDEFNQVILNIIVNAAHAIEENGMSASNILGTINIHVSLKNNSVVIKITDNGAGMSPEVKHRIFDPFYTTKTVGKGTGQGLSMAYSVIVERHQGTITAESEVGVGTSFFLELPIIQEKKSAEICKEAVGEL